MEVLPLNPLAGLRLRAIAAGLEQIAPKLATELEIPQDIVEGALVEFAVLCSRTRFAPGEVDFETAVAIDAPEEMARKAITYLGSECQAAINEAFEKIANGSASEQPKAQRPPRRKK
jgi:hypothetical protein